MKLNRQGLLAAVAAATAMTFAAEASAQDHITQFTTQDGTIVTLRSGQPAPVHYGPPPPFDQLDTDHDGSISQQEAEGYIPLLNDFDYVAPHSSRISRRQYENWARTQFH